MTNKSVQALGLTAMLFAGAALSIEPAHAASATGDATVKILRAITVTKSSDLDFGKIVPSAAAATVVGIGRRGGSYDAAATNIAVRRCASI